LAYRLFFPHLGVRIIARTDVTVAVARERDPECGQRKRVDTPRRGAVDHAAILEVQVRRPHPVHRLRVGQPLHPAADRAAFRHAALPRCVVDAEDRSGEIAPFIAKGVKYVVEPIIRKNMAAVLARFVSRGDLILNLSVEVSSIDVMAWCQKNGVLYLDTCIEPWANYYANPKIPEEQRTNYYLRYAAREQARKWPRARHRRSSPMGPIRA